MVLRIVAAPCHRAPNSNQDNDNDDKASNPHHHAQSLESQLAPDQSDAAKQPSSPMNTTS
jgi:hypothetical protein